MLPVRTRDGAPVVDVTALRAALTSSTFAFREALASNGLRLDLASLTPLSRWVTPAAEPKRFDTHFFLARAPHGLAPRSDEREAIRVLWSTPRALLAEYESGAITLFPPTHRSLEWLAEQFRVGRGEDITYTGLCRLRVARHFDEDKRLTKANRAARADLWSQAIMLIAHVRTALLTRPCVASIEAALKP